MLVLRNLKKNIPLAPYTTFKIGGPAKYFFVAKSIDDLVMAVKKARDENLKIFLLGLGSNILVADRGFDGLVIKNETRGLKFEENKIYVESGLPNGILVTEAVKRGLAGLEILAGVPGTIGGSIYGNAGNPNQSVGDVVHEISVFDLKNKIKKLIKANCKFTYRESIFKKNEDIILSGRMILKRSAPETISAAIKDHLKKRKQAQPIGAWCAGSVFKNPSGTSAWQLIEKAGLKGKRIGGAQVSEKHANFIINNGQATAEQVIMLISLIKQQVRDKLGIQLEEEIKFVGF